MGGALVRQQRVMRSNGIRPRAGWPCRRYVPACGDGSVLSHVDHAVRVRLPFDGVRMRSGVVPRSTGYGNAKRTGESIPCARLHSATAW